MQVSSWVVQQVATPMTPELRAESAGPGEVIVQVAGCGVCHTDLGFFYDGVPTRHPFPLTLGHEISGTVVEAGAGAEAWLGRGVVVPAVLPCGECPACRAGRGQICPKQIFPGSDVHGGFASHVRLPARGLCPVPDLRDRAINPGGIELADLSVVADAISTPYQAIVRSGLGAGDVAVFVGAGGVGGFGIQVAAALGAAVVAIDVNRDRLAQMAEHGASLTIDPAAIELKDLRKHVRAFADSRGVPSWRVKIFETSGSTKGQATAFALLGHGGYLSVVGYTPQTVELRFSNLMAFDATAQGNWGCLPEHYPAIVGLVLKGSIALAPFIERRPLATINDVFAELHAGGVLRRLVLIPES
ncbi:MAG: 6-hydroxycyclohex-1-ene-1-carbonyl-CoA dehydrogenase [Vicinamibacterales bacterium]|jgi:6-hydroxycyclohex-1-ene-1-carbonyl-CoA dehydrogenase